MTDFQHARDLMVDRQIARRGIRDERVLDAMRQVPREAFVGERYAGLAHDDAPLPIGEGQTISQPYIVAVMIEAAELKPDDKVLEVGSGSGYATAVMSRLAGRIHAVERYPSLAEEAASRLERLGFNNVETHVGDGTLGWPQAAPFDAILVAAAGPSIPVALQEQLAVGGRLVVPVGAGESQRLIRVRRRSAADFDREDLAAVRFVPLIGAQGWKRGDGDPDQSPSPEASSTEGA